MMQRGDFMKLVDCVVFGLFLKRIVTNGTFFQKGFYDSFPLFSFLDILSQEVVQLYCLVL
jgi:hypothetical protein